MDENLQKFQDELGKLKERFAAGLDERVAKLEEDWVALSEEFALDRLERLHRGVHSLAGSGTTFGLPDVSRAARLLEAPLKELLQAGEKRSVRALSGLKDVWEEFKRVCNSVKAEFSPDSSCKHDDCPPIDAGPEQRQGVSRDVVLVTVDEGLFRELSVRLSRFGYAVTKAGNWPDAVPPDSAAPFAVLMDCDSVPAEGTSGGLQHWKQKNVPLLVLSFDDSMDSRLRAVRLGAEDYLLKPVDVGVLLDKFESLSFRNPSEPFRVLIVDDEEFMAEHNAILLRQNGMDARTLTDPMRILDVLEGFSAEIVLLDVYMPGCSGPEAAAVLRQKNDFLGLPILYLSGETELKEQFNAVSQGGDDFLIKPIEPEHLLRSVSNRVKRYRSVHSMMVHDSLTGLLNHTNMKQQIKTEIERLNREGGIAALAIIDLDKFKSVNDRYGHPAGDVVLKNLSRFLSQRLRRSDLAGRIGGEEFAVLLRGIARQDEAVAVMDKLREAFSEVVHSGDWGEVLVTFSCGLAFFPDYSDAGSLGAAADMALYEAKRSGRNQVKVQKAFNEK